MTRVRVNTLRLLAFAVVALAATSAVHWTLRTSAVRWNDGCGDDGFEYCALVRGEPARLPWARRILVPSVVRVLDRDGTDLPSTFRAVNLFALAVSAGGAAALVREVASRRGARRARVASASLLAAALMVLMPMGFRWTWFYPVLVDGPAAAFGVVWFVAATSRRPWATALAPSAAAAATLSREVWLVAIPATALTLLAVRRDLQRVVVVVVSLAAVAVAGWVVFTAPGLPNSEIALGTTDAMHWLRENLTTTVGQRHYAWMALFAWGLLPALLLRRARRWLDAARDDTAGKEPIVVPALAMVAAHAGVALVGGGDIHRFLFAAAPFVLALVLGHVAACDDLDMDLVIVLFASVLVWRPFQVLGGDRHGYLEFFSPWYLGGPASPNRFFRDILLIASPVLWWIALALSRRPRGTYAVKPGTVIGT